jgi:hypothetical protein
VGHLTHIEECDWLDRTRVILEHGTERIFDPVDPEAGFARFRGWKLGDLLGRFNSVRASNLETLGALVDAEDLGRLGGSSFRSSTHPDPRVQACARIDRPRARPLT